jgi:hypothetical protein
MSGVDPLLALDRPCAPATSRTATSSCCSPRYRLHVGGERRTLGPARRLDDEERDDERFDDLIGKELGPTEWFEVDQERIDGSPRRPTTPVDPHRPVRAAEGPFGTTIAHGFLTLSLCVPLMTQTLALTGYRWASTTASTRCGSRRPSRRARASARAFTVQSVEEVAGGEQASSSRRSSGRAATSPSASPSSSRG